MAGEERGGVFAFVVLTIALSVAVTLGIAVMFLKMENKRYLDTDTAFRKEVNKNEQLERRYLAAKKEIDRLRTVNERIKEERGRLPDTPERE